jgi:hypothetical protein
MQMIGPPPKTVLILGKEYFPAEATIAHLKELRAELQRCTLECNQLRRTNEALRLEILGPR